MTQSLRIDFVSDIACPWCAIGLSSLMQAVERTRDVVDAHVVMHPFELNPQMGPKASPSSTTSARSMAARRNRSPRARR